MLLGITVILFIVSCQGIYKQGRMTWVDIWVNILINGLCSCNIQVCLEMERIMVSELFRKRSVGCFISKMRCIWRQILPHF